MTTFLGTGVALVTPFKSDFSVDYDALTKIVDFNINSDINYLVVLGTTGEPATLTNSEKSEVIKTVINTNAGRVPLVLGIGGNNTAEIVSELKTNDLSNFSAILSVSPYYSKPSQEGIYQHFSAVANASPLPIILYNVPSRTGSNMLPETVARLANDLRSSWRYGSGNEIIANLP
jgi:4-hydroxy-tetrahydrodipicolinate synthase